MNQRQPMGEASRRGTQALWMQLPCTLEQVARARETVDALGA